MNLTRNTLYGDGVFESMLLKNNQIALWPYHFQRLTNSLQYLGIHFDLSAETLLQIIQNHLTQNALNHEPLVRIRLTIYRQSQGLYLPQTNHFAFDITATAYQTPPPVNTINTINYYTENLKIAQSPLSNHKTTSSALYVLAALYKQQQNLDEIILLNQYQRIVEAGSSNIYLLKNNQIRTPLLTEGPINGVFRTFLLDNFNIEETTITQNDLETADEVFTSNAIQGLRPVVHSPLGKPYQTTQTNKLMHNIKQILKN